MRDWKSRIQLVAFLQLQTEWDQGQCLPLVMGTEIQSRCPLRHPKPGTLPISTWMLAHVPICQDGTGPQASQVLFIGAGAVPGMVLGT